MRLARKHSINQRVDFLRVRKKGLSKAGRYLILSTLEDTKLDHLKVGIITTKRVGKAHERNRLRRRVRAIIQRHGESLFEPRRYMVTIPLKGASEATFDELEKDWLRLARRLKLVEGILQT